MRAVDSGGQIVIAQKCLFIKMMHPPSKLWESGFFGSFFFAQGTLLQESTPSHNYVLTLGSMGDGTPPTGCRELLCCFSALLLGYGVIYLKLKDRKKDNIYNRGKTMCGSREKSF
jgi:hypothetical protein